MKNPKLGEIGLFPLLGKMKIKTWRDLEHFMQMPSNPSTKKELKIAKFILENIKNGNKEKIREEDIINNFFKSELVEDNKTKKEKAAKVAWQKTKHRLQKTFQRYYAMRTLENHPLEGILLAELYDQHGLVKQKRSIIKNRRKKLSNSFDHNNSLYEYWFAELDVRDKTSNSKKTKYDIDSDLMEQKLDEFYFEKKIRCFCMISSQKDKKTTRVFEDIPQVIIDQDNFLKLLKQNFDKINSSKTISYYYLFHLLELKEEKDYLGKILHLLSNNFDEIDKVTEEEIYFLLLNFYIRNINAGELKYGKNYLVLTSRLLDNGVIFTKKQLPVNLLKNTIGIALISGNIERAWKLFDQHNTSNFSKLVDGKYMLNLMKATILFYEEKYQEADKILQPSLFENRFHDLSVQYLQLKLDYSLEKDKKSLSKTKILLKKQIKADKKLSTSKKQFRIVFLRMFQKLLDQKLIKPEEYEKKIPPIDEIWLKRMVERRDKHLVSSQTSDLV